MAAADPPEPAWSVPDDWRGYQTWHNNQPASPPAIPPLASPGAAGGVVEPYAPEYVVPTPTTTPQDNRGPGAPREMPPASPVDTRGLDELFPDPTEPPSQQPLQDHAAASHSAASEPPDIARPLIYSGLTGMVLSATGITVVLIRRRAL